MRVKFLFLHLFLLTISYFNYALEFSPYSSIEKVDVTGWRKFDMVLGFLDDQNTSKIEKVSLLFPGFENVVNGSDGLESHVFAQDPEGMKYTFWYLPMASDLNLNESFDFLINAFIRNSSKKNIFTTKYKEVNRDTNKYTIQWLEGSKLLTQHFVKSDNFIYLLETYIEIPDLEYLPTEYFTDSYPWIDATSKSIVFFENFHIND